MQNQHFIPILNIFTVRGSIAPLSFTFLDCLLQQDVKKYASFSPTSVKQEQTY